MDVINGCMVAILVLLGVFLSMLIYYVCGDSMDKIYWDLEGGEMPMKELPKAAKVLISLLIAGAIVGFFPMMIGILGI